MYKLLIVFYILVSLTSASAAMYAPKLLWDKKSVKVCLVDRKSQLLFNSASVADYAWDSLVSHQSVSDYISRIKYFVNKNFNPESTGVHFTGWKPCSKTWNADAYIYFFYSATSGHVSSSTVGDIRNRKKLLGIIDFPMRRSMLGINIYRLEKDLKLDDVNLSATVVHEFAHLAGLFHEMDRPEFIKEASCVDFKVYEGEGVCKIKYKELLSELGKLNLYGAFDHESVTNYCYNSKALREKLISELSPQDKRALKRAYKNKK